MTGVPMLYRTTRHPRPVSRDLANGVLVFAIVLLLGLVLMDLHRLGVARMGAGW